MLKHGTYAAQKKGCTCKVFPNTENPRGANTVVLASDCPLLDGTNGSRQATKPNLSKIVSKNGR